MYVCMYLCMYVCMYVCMLCMYVFMYVCMYVFFIFNILFIDSMLHYMYVSMYVSEFHHQPGALGVTSIKLRTHYLQSEYRLFAGWGDLKTADIGVQPVVLVSYPQHISGRNDI